MQPSGSQSEPVTSHKRATKPSFVHGDWVQVYVDPDEAGGPGFIRIEERYGAPGVAILPISRGMVGLVTLYRRTVGGFTLEIPRGFGGESDSIRGDAVRELQQETGIELNEAELIDLGFVSPNTGIMNARVAVFAATLDSPTVQDIPDIEEVDAFNWYTLAQVQEFIAEGRVDDSFTLGALYKATIDGLI
jgi:8-oxo-dGTP pyrophosphatase MutT (NUDIX family)